MTARVGFLHVEPSKWVKDLFKQTKMNKNGIPYWYIYIYIYMYGCVDSTVYSTSNIQL